MDYFFYYCKCLCFKKNKVRDSEISLSVNNNNFTEDSVRVFDSFTESTFITQTCNENSETNNIENTFNPLTVNTISIDQVTSSCANV